MSLGQALPLQNVTTLHAPLLLLLQGSAFPILLTGQETGETGETKLGQGASRGQMVPPVPIWGDATLICQSCHWLKLYLKACSLMLTHCAQQGELSGGSFRLQVPIQTQSRVVLQLDQTSFQSQLFYPFSKVALSQEPQSIHLQARITLWGGHTVQPQHPSRCLPALPCHLPTGPARSRRFFEPSYKPLPKLMPASADLGLTPVLGAQPAPLPKPVLRL